MSQINIASLDYIESIKDFCLPNKYTNWYCNIITKRLQDFSSRKEAKEALGYCEGHHILPRAFKLGGEKDKANIVFLSAREHYICHLLLVKMISGSLKYRMAAGLGRLRKKCGNSRSYNLAKTLSSKYSPNKLQEVKSKKLETYMMNYELNGPAMIEQKKRTSLDRYGVEHYTQTSEYKQKYKTTCIERYGVDSTNKVEEVKDKKMNAFKQKYGDHVKWAFQSEEVKQKIAQTNMQKYGYDNPSKSSEIQDKKRKNSLLKNGVEHHNQLTIKCPHCEMISTRLIMYRWHFDNCKHKLKEAV